MLFRSLGWPRFCISNKDTKRVRPDCSEMEELGWHSACPGHSARISTKKKNESTCICISIRFIGQELPWTPPSGIWFITAPWDPMYLGNPCASSSQNPTIAGQSVSALQRACAISDVSLGCGWKACPTCWAHIHSTCRVETGQNPSQDNDPLARRLDHGTV